MTTDIATVPPSPLAQILADPDRLKEFPIETVERLFALDREMRPGRGAARILPCVPCAARRPRRPFANSGGE